jgi:hypothetical protein
MGELSSRTDYGCGMCETVQNSGSQTFVRKK